MAGEARITLHDRYVLVSVKGDQLSPAEVKSTLSKATEQAIESNRDIIILRETPVKELGSNVEFFFYAEFLEDSPFRNRLALVAPEEVHHSSLDYFERLLGSRGIGFRFFSTFEEAVQWITGGQDE